MKRTLIAALALGATLAWAGTASAASHAKKPMADGKPMMADGKAMAKDKMAMTAGNAEKGKKIFKKCKACHAYGPKAKNKVGPQLNGIVGRKAASAKGYRYSKGMKTAAAGGLVWEEAKLSEYLTKPRKFIKGTKMAFAGIKKADQLADLIAFLNTLK